MIIRYLVTDVHRSVLFYTQLLGFVLDEEMGSAFAKVSKGDCELWLSGPQSSAARPMPDGHKPRPGGWNRFVVTVKNLSALVKKIKRFGAIFRNEIVVGPGGKQIVLEDPSGNPIELFEPEKPL